MCVKSVAGQPIPGRVIIPWQVWCMQLCVAPRACRNMQLDCSSSHASDGPAAVANRRR
jgi:hypothetical protein